MQGAAGYYAVPLGSLEGILAVLEAHLGRLGGLFGRLGALWGLSWEPLGPFWSHLGGFLDDLGGPLGRLGLSENPKKEETPKSIKHLMKVRVLASSSLPGGLLGGIFGAS